MKKAKPAQWDPSCVNFVINTVPQSDIDALITPDEKDVVNIIPETFLMEDIVVELGKFPSKGQARKNGWAGPVPDGFNMWQIGKNFQFCTLRMV